MDALQFQHHARGDEPLRTFLQEIADEVAPQVAAEQPDRYLTVTGADLLFSLAAYALYRFLKDYFDHRRARHEAELLQQQQQVVAALIQDGFPPKEAQATVVALLKGIAKRTEDDPALKTALGLLGKDKKP
jgi:hypothetical protein